MNILSNLDARARVAPEQIVLGWFMKATKVPPQGMETDLLAVLGVGGPIGVGADRCEAFIDHGGELVCGAIVSVRTPPHPGPGERGWWAGRSRLGEGRGGRLVGREGGKEGGREAVREGRV